MKGGQRIAQRKLVHLAALLLGLAAAARAQPAPVIVISVDTLRADHLSAYGYRRVRTPQLDSFAVRGTLFTDAQTQIPLTLPSHTVLFTSTYPFQSRIEENAEPVPAGAVTLASVLRGHGYRTAAFIGSVFLERQMGLDQGFEEYDSPFHFAAFSALSGEMFFAGPPRNQVAVRDRRDGMLVVHAAARWLAAHRGQAAFVFVHLFDLHTPYPAGSNYDGQLAAVDRAVGWFRQALEAGGWWRRSLVVLLADHGEGLGDHGEESHGYFIYQSTMRVPLIFHWPEGEGTHAARDTRPAGLVDVAPTILDFLRIAPPASFEGHSLLRRAGDPEVYGESLHTHDAFGWAPLRSLRVGRYEYIQAPRPELYDLAADAREQHNLVTRLPGEARDLRERMARLLASRAARAPERTVNVSPRGEALLESLGYVASGPRALPAAAAPDPKDRLDEFRLYQQAQADLADGRLTAAIAALRTILARDPRNLLARRDLGGVYFERRRYAQAEACLKQVLAAAPGDYVTQYELGLADERLGRLAEARAHLHAACRIAPDSAQCQGELEQVKRKRSGR